MHFENPTVVLRVSEMPCLLYFISEKCENRLHVRDNYYALHTTPLATIAVA